MVFGGTHAMCPIEQSLREIRHLKTKRSFKGGLYKLKIVIPLKVTFHNGDLSVVEVL